MTDADEALAGRSRRLIELADGAVADAAGLLTPTDRLRVTNALLFELRDTLAHWLSAFDHPPEQPTRKP